MRPSGPLLAAVTLFTLAACGAPSKAQRVQEAAYDLNMGLRFGRMDVALERVAQTERRNFVERHRAWNGQIRIVDVELSGMDLRDNDAEVYLVVAWQRLDGTVMRSTVVKQKFKDSRSSGWVLVGEEAVQGDQGLFARGAAEAG